MPKKIGNAADINLLLVAMLNKAGIEANPVILSTRENGFIAMAHPSLSDCNYVVARAVVDGKQILLDATEPNLQAVAHPFSLSEWRGTFDQQGVIGSHSTFQSKISRNYPRQA